MTPTSRMVARANELRNEGGFSYTKTAELLEVEFGVRVHRITVRRWTDPDAADAKRADDTRRNRVLRAAASSGRLGRHDQSPDFQVARARALSGFGLTQMNVARAMEFDYPDGGWSYKRVRVLLGPAREKTA